MNASLANPLRTEHIGRNMTPRQQPEDEKKSRKLKEEVRNIISIFDKRVSQTN